MHRGSRTRASLAFGLMGVLFLTACGDDDTDSAAGRTTTTVERTTTTDGTTTTTEAEPEDESAAVIEAYTEHWEIFYAFLNGDGPGDPADYFAGLRLADLPGQIAEASEKGLEGRGAPQLEPGRVTIDGNEAAFTDCQLDLTFAVSKSTGETVVPPSTKPQEVAVEMVKSDGTWKVASVVYGPEGSCVQ